MAPTLLSLLVLASGASAAVTGQLIAFRASATGPSDHQRLGCVTANGRVATTGCANFTLGDDYSLFSGERSQCRSYTSDEPENTDANWGPGLRVHALGCGPQYLGPPPATSLYYLGATGDRVLCTFNLNCAWDLKSIPTAGSQVFAWPFFTSSDHLDVPQGHQLVTLEFR